MTVEYFPFRPALDGPFAKRFYERIKDLAEARIVYPAIEATVEEEVKWAVELRKTNPRQRRIYRAVWLLFRDLLRIGWSYRWSAGTLEIAPPSLLQEAHSEQEIQQAKQIVREAMVAPRRERIAEAKEFIERMENPSVSGRAIVPISKLIGDGESLAATLTEIAAISDKSEQLQKLQTVIQPYLQLVTEARCEHTGHRLNDIWRYFRLTWTTPIENTPGRTMWYLIRDAAQPYHPIIGIASLENAPLRIACRDDYLGWSFEAFQAEVETAPDEETVRAAFTRLLDYVRASITEISLEDLCTPEQCQNPDKALFQKLAGIIIRSSADHAVAMNDWRSWLKSRDGDDEDDDEETVLIEQSDLGHISRAAEEALYRHKRAERLLQLLTAQQDLELLLRRPDFGILWRRFLTRDTGQVIIKTALKAQKNRHIGTSILELNVCGAIPPYNEILGGKLVAMLMLSPQVIADYRARYGGRPSDIASKMKGEPVIRPAELVYIGTTSLYRIGSSQYNRLKLKDKLFGENSPEVRWQQLGETSGYGTLHISRVTLKSLEEAASKNGNVYVNHIFGEGASPKLRAMRQALAVVLETGQKVTEGELTRHSMSRLVYGVWLATNGRELLSGKAAQPTYYFDPEIDPQEGSQQIINFWRERWLLKRLAHVEALDRMRKFEPQTLLVSQDLLEIEAAKFTPISEEVSTMPITPADEPPKLRELARNLYRGLSAYADNMQPDWLEAIHVGTDLDREVIKAVQAGKSVVLTGNPGDGKTHLLRILAKRLETLPNQPVVELDASAVSNAELKTRWEMAQAQGKPFCIAVNEAVLKDLADTYRDFTLLQEAQRQVEQAVIYRDEPGIDSSVVVFDLSRRNILAAKIVNQVLDKLTDSQRLTPCPICPEEGCDFVQNQKLLTFGASL